MLFLTRTKCFISTMLSWHKIKYNEFQVFTIIYPKKSSERCRCLVTWPEHLNGLRVCAPSLPLTFELSWRFTKRKMSKMLVALKKNSGCLQSKWNLSSGTHENPQIYSNSIHSAGPTNIAAYNHMAEVNVMSHPWAGWTIHCDQTQKSTFKMTKWEL